jgi:hypothetical protein
MVACIHFFEMSEICRPKFIVRHNTILTKTFFSNSTRVVDVDDFRQTNKIEEINNSPGMLKK